MTGPRLRAARGQDTFSDLAGQPGDPICAPQRVDRRDRRGGGHTRPSENQETREPSYNSYHDVLLRTAPPGAVMVAVPSERDPQDAPIRMPTLSTMAPPRTIWNTACRNGVSM